MQKKLNLKIKFREIFRPFTPSVLEEKLQVGLIYPQLVHICCLLVKSNKIKIKNDNLKKLSIFDQLNQVRSSVPAITHVDYSARIQTVNKSNNKKFYDLLEKFEKHTNCPILINTSFNVRGEPIVCSPEDAYRCFMGNDLDYLILGNYIIEKKKQKKKI